MAAKRIGVMSLWHTGDTGEEIAGVELEIDESTLRERCETVFAAATYAPMRSVAAYRIGEQDIALSVEFTANRARTAVQAGMEKYEVVLKFDPPGIDKATLPFALRAAARGEFGLKRFSLVDPGRNQAAEAQIDAVTNIRIRALGNCECTVVTMMVPGVPSLPPQKFYYSLEHDHTLVRISWGEQVMDLVGHDNI